MAHTFTDLLIHALFSTQERRPLLDDELKPQLFAYLGGIVRNLRGELLLVNGPSDHVHLLLLLPAPLSVSDLIEKVKGGSSRWVHERWPARSSFAWQTGYAAFSVSHTDRERIRKYIANQEEHHRRVTYQEEVLTFLKEHEVEYDPRFVFE